MRGQVVYDGQEQDQITRFKIQQIKKRTRNGIIAAFLFVVLVLVIVGYRYHDTFDLIQDGSFYRKIRDFQILKKKQEIVNNVKKQGSLAVKNKQLGRMSWTVLHMASGAFPKQFDQNLSQKFITFLQLFAQLYPCKECGRLFLKKMQQKNQFKGNKKSDLMIYLCELHNNISEQIGEQVHSCENVEEEWNTCGCSQ